MTVPVFVITLIIDVNSHGITPYEVNTTYYYYSKHGKNTTHLWVMLYEKAPASKFNYFFTFINSNDHKVSFSRQ